MSSFLKQFAADQSGSPATEYAIMASLIAVAIVGTLQIVGVSVSGLYATVSGAF